MIVTRPDDVERHVRGHRSDEGAAALVDPRKAEPCEHHGDLQDQRVDRRRRHVVHQPERQRRRQGSGPEPMPVADGPEQHAAEEELLADGGEHHGQHHEEALGEQGEPRRHLLRNGDVVAHRLTEQRGDAAADQPDGGDEDQTCDGPEQQIAPDPVLRRRQHHGGSPLRMPAAQPDHEHADHHHVADDRGEDLGLADRAVDHRRAQQRQDRDLREPRRQERDEVDPDPFEPSPRRTRTPIVRRALRLRNTGARVGTRGDREIHVVIMSSRSRNDT